MMTKKQDTSQWNQFDVAHAATLVSKIAGMPDPPDGGDGGNGEPPVGSIDLLPYFNGNGSRIVYELGHNQVMGGGTELLQTQLEGGGFRHVKQGGASRYSKWERLCANNTYIYRDLDTSGDAEVYRLKDSTIPAWSRWCPRFMSVNQVYRRNPTVTWLNKTTGQPVPGKTYQETSDIKLDVVMTSYTVPENGLVVPDVIRLAYMRPDSSNWIERYYYAKNYGLVAWENSNGWRSYISVLHSPHPAPVPETLGAWANAPAIPADETPPTTTVPFPPTSDPGWDFYSVSAVSGSTNVRAQPNTTSAVVGTITSKKVYHVNMQAFSTQPDGKWYPIYGGINPLPNGWVRNDVVLIEEVPPVDPPQPEKKSFTMTATIEIPVSLDIEMVKSVLKEVFGISFK